LLLLVSIGLLGAASAQTESVLYSFCSQTNCTDGENPNAVAFDKRGDLYGTTQSGGYGVGVVFKLTPRGEETVLHSFCKQPPCTDGELPYSGVIFDPKGNLYGTTYYGGSRLLRRNGHGVVFRVTPSGNESVLYGFGKRHITFTDRDGINPVGGVVLHKDGNLYGTTYEGGAYGYGVVFKLTLTGKATILYSFCSQHNCTDGAKPEAGIVFDQKGNLYGTTAEGGAYGCGGDGCGVVFRLSPGGMETVLYSFCTLSSCVDGAGPLAGLVRDKAGNLYGTTISGGTGGDGYVGEGVVFKLTPTGEETVLYSLCSQYEQGECPDGAGPQAGLIRDRKGNLYGTTGFGGAYDSRGGVVFKVTPDGKETVLYSFCAQSNCTDGQSPKAGLVFDQQGNLYGTTVLGGTHGDGVVFKLMPKSHVR